MPPTVKPLSTGVRLMTIATLAVMLVLFGGLAACFLLTIHVENGDKTLHAQQRVPACKHAFQVVSSQDNSNDARSAGMALYQATGCPQVFQQLRMTP